MHFHPFRHLGGHYIEAAVRRIDIIGQRGVQEFCWWRGQAMVMKFADLPARYRRRFLGQL